MNTTKPFHIPKDLVWEAWRKVKANGGAAGIDHQSLKEYEEKLGDNLYQLWNRMASGSYFPPPVKGVEIPKKSGGFRLLGVPTCSDRIAQTIVKLKFEPIVERIFLPDSYGYRPGKSAHDAIGAIRQRCWKSDWILEFDIRGLFDEMQHALIMKAVRHHTDCKWMILYIERWLKAPIQLADGTLKNRDKGTPQGGCVSPVLSNLFLHYVFDKWMQRTFPTIEWARYADDGLLHCKSHKQAQMLLKAITTRFKECGLEIHSDKTKIVYCRDGNRTKNFENVEFRFLGFHFRARNAVNQRTGQTFQSFQPAIGKETLAEMRNTIKWKWKLGSAVHKSLEELAREFNPIIRGWLNYYGKFYVSALKSLAFYIDCKLMKWAMYKFLKLKGHKKKTVKWLEKVFQTNPKLFVHWEMFAVC